MVQEAFNKFFWGFLFIILDFRIQGVDVMADVIGFIMFAMGFLALAEHSPHFIKGKSYNHVMIFLSLFSIYERPAQSEVYYLNPLGIIVGMISLILTILVVYHLFMGIKDMASKRERFDIEQEATQKWIYFFIFQIIALLSIVIFFIPSLFILLIFALFIASIILTIVLMLFMKKCGREL